MTVTLVLLSWATIGFTIGICWLAIKLKRKGCVWIYEAWSDLLNSIAASVP